VSISIKLGVDPGEDLDHVIAAAVRIARHLDVTVRFKFNGTKCYAMPYDDAEYVVRRYHCEYKKIRMCGIRACDRVGQ